MISKTIKINPRLKRKVENFISKPENEIRYPTIKSFIDESVVKHLVRESLKKQF